MVKRVHGRVRGGFGPLPDLGGVPLTSESAEQSCQPEKAVGWRTRNTFSAAREEVGRATIARDGKLRCVRNLRSDYCVEVMRRQRGC